MICGAKSDSAVKVALVVALGYPTGKNLEKVREIRKIAKSSFFDFCLPWMQLEVPISMIWGTECNSGVKTALAVALGVLLVKLRKTAKIREAAKSAKFAVLQHLGLSRLRRFTHLLYFSFRLSSYKRSNFLIYQRYIVTLSFCPLFRNRQRVNWLRSDGVL